ncbi:hypothetical protein RSJ42_09685 [Methanosarcina hadiensis]
MVELIQDNIIRDSFRIVPAHRVDPDAEDRNWQQESELTVSITADCSV